VPSFDLLEIAVKILDSFIGLYGTETKYLESEGAILSQEETERQVRDYIAQIDA
jgi:hypothetical protein